MKMSHWAGRENIAVKTMYMLDNKAPGVRHQETGESREVR